MQKSQGSSTIPSHGAPPIKLDTVSKPSINTPSTSTGASSISDLQTQIVVMLNDTLSRFTTALADIKSSETKADSPKISIDTKKFWAWHLAIMAQMFCPLGRNYMILQ
jgi:hypothetical protein